MRKIVIVLSVLFLVFANVVSAATSCCFEEADNQSIAMHDMDMSQPSMSEDCHEEQFSSSSDSDSSAGLDHSHGGHDCQCETCPQTKNSIELISFELNLQAQPNTVDSISSPFQRISVIDKPPKA